MAVGAVRVAVVAAVPSPCASRTALPLVGARYSTGGGFWQPLTFTGGQATFSATAEYEVAVRCQSSPQVYLFKATVGQTTALVFSCSGLSNRDFQVTLPSSIGTQSIQNGDTVSISSASGTYSGSNPVNVSAFLAGGPQDLLVSVLRPTSPTSTTPIGYKLVNLNLTGPGPFAVDDTGWQPFAAIRNIIPPSPPAGFTGGASVSFFKDGMKAAFPVGIFDKYGLLSQPGKYLGFASYSSSSHILLTLQDTGGNNWSPGPSSLMSPWPAGGFSVNNDTLSFNHPQAQVYQLNASGLIEDTGGSPLSVQVQVYGSGSVTYTLPVVPGLNYALSSFASRNVSGSLSAIQGNPGVLIGAGTLTEAGLSGLDLRQAGRLISFTGSSYTLP